MRVLVIEDERKIAAALKGGLEAEHFDVVVARTGEEGFFEANAAAFDVVVLDLMLPGRDGLEILRTLRARGAQTPVLILTARDAVEDRVTGLDSGADDYLVKPFAFAELLARIRALLRRGRTDTTLRLKAADLDMDLVTRRVTRGGRELELSPREFELLEYLLRHETHTVTREMLARDVWKDPVRATPLDNVIDVQIARLRRKAVVNLLDNAIRHSPEGRSIRIVVGEGVAPSITVVDEGPGIAPEHLRRIFDRFYRADPARSREAGGTGLGLAIARWAVEINGGRIEVESTVGQGSAFRIVLPPVTEE